MTTWAVEMWTRPRSVKRRVPLEWVTPTPAENAEARRLMIEGEGYRPNGPEDLLALTLHLGEYLMEYLDSPVELVPTWSKIPGMYRLDIYLLREDHGVTTRHPYGWGFVHRALKDQK